MLELSLATFVERVADSAAVPASGCVAALQGALGAALFSMAFEHAAGEGRSDQAAYMRGRAQELSELSRRLLDLVDEDAEAYRAFLASRDEARRKALQQALEVPLELAETALAGLRLGAVGVAEVADALHSECLVGVDALEAAVRGGIRIVRANAQGLEAEEGWLEERLAVLPLLERQAAELSREVRAATTRKP